MSHATLNLSKRVAYCSARCRLRPQIRTPRLAIEETADRNGRRITIGDSLSDIGLEVIRKARILEHCGKK